MPVRLMLDYDIIDKEEVEEDARILDSKYNLGGYTVESSDTTSCWHVVFPLTEFKTFEEAFEIAKESKCDKGWLMFCARFKLFAIKTATVKKFQEHASRKISSRPIEEIPSPIILVVKPKNDMELKRVVKLSESIEDKTWLWRISTPLIGIYENRDNLSNVEIGCENHKQADRRIDFLKGLNIDADYEVKNNERY